MSCTVGNYAINGTCKACPANAVSCPFGEIDKCNDGFYIDNNTCVACGAGAKTCSSNTTALSCMPSYGLSGTKCNACLAG